MRIIRGKYGRRRFDVHKNITARPTTDFARENLFNVLDNIVDLEGKTALDLFSGTGAISFELLSRGCSSVTSVEKAAVQSEFIRSVSAKLGAEGHRIIRGDALRFITTARARYDLIFADPPYDMPGFADIPRAVLEADLLNPGGIFIIEHSGAHSFDTLPGFIDHRTYGSVNFTLFRKPAPAAESTTE